MLEGLAACKYQMRATLLAPICPAILTATFAFAILHISRASRQVHAKDGCGFVALILRHRTNQASLVRTCMQLPSLRWAPSVGPVCSRKSAMYSPGFCIAHPLCLGPSGGAWPAFTFCTRAEMTVSQAFVACMSRPGKLQKAAKTQLHTWSLLRTDESGRSDSP